GVSDVGLGWDRPPAAIPRPMAHYATSSAPASPIVRTCDGLLVGAATRAPDPTGRTRLANELQRLPQRTAGWAGAGPRRRALNRQIRRRPRAVVPAGGAALFE